jgi:hypothetical protein
VRALFDETPAVHDEDAIHVAQRREPVGDDGGRPVAGELQCRATLKIWTG